jgi:hypothetical protein
LAEINKSYSFDKEFIEKSENLFESKFVISETSYLLSIKNQKNKSDVSLEIIKDNGVHLISVYTNNCHLQLHSCSHFLVSDMLEEILFVSAGKDYISSIIISKQGDCSLYSNVKKEILSSDFANLNSEKLISAVALSITEDII